MIRSFFTIILFPCFLFAQTEIWVSVGRTGPSSSFYSIDKSAFLDLYWAKGVSVAGGLHFALTNSLWLSPEINYAYFRWDNFNFYGVMIPEQTIRSASGNNSNIYRFMLNARLYARSSSFIRFYILTGIGYTIEKIGKIQALVEDMNGPSFIWDIQYRGRSYPTHSLGLGFRLEVIDPMSIDVTARYFTDYSKRFHTSVNLGLIYSFSR